jgi:1,4-dihydroxy-6-naphthoate synthase
MKLTLGFSPCPNDTFIFDALVNKKIDIGEFEFDFVLEDVQQLNQNAINNRYDISKISFGVYPKIANHYLILNSGSALGKGVGPLLITRNADLANISKYKIAIPGEDTTAHYLFSHAYPSATNKIFLPYNKIEDYITDSDSLGVIIHENRFTYQERGFLLVKDLGAYWEQKMGLPIPLGGIVIRRELSTEIQQKVDYLIKKSILFAFENKQSLPDFIKKNAQEMSEKVMQDHINLYVNQYSIDIGSKGKFAIQSLLAGLESSSINNSELDFFVKNDFFNS